MYLASSIGEGIPVISETGEIIYPLIDAQLGSAKRSSSARVIIPSRCFSIAHYHRKAEEMYFMLRGEAEMTVNGRTFPLSKNQSLLVHPGDVHQIRNKRRQDVEFLVVCTPLWTQEDYFPADQ